MTHPSFPACLASGKRQVRHAKNQCQWCRSWTGSGEDKFPKSSLKLADLVSWRTVAFCKQAHGSTSATFSAKEQPLLACPSFCKCFSLTWLRNWGAGFLSYVLNSTLTQGKASQGKPRQHKPRTQMTYSESGWCLAEPIASSLGDRVAAWILVGPVPLACHSQPMPWLCKIHFGGYSVAREAGSISRSK